jgi:hypothetical protein
MQLFHSHARATRPRGTLLYLTSTSAQILVLESFEGFRQHEILHPGRQRFSGIPSNRHGTATEIERCAVFQRLCAMPSARCRRLLTRTRSSVCRAMSIGRRFRVLGESRICLTMEISRASHDRSDEAVSIGVRIALGFFRQYAFGYRISIGIVAPLTRACGR